MTFEYSEFLLSIVMMVVVGALFVVVPLYKFTRENTNKGLKSSWYRSRLAELEEELAAGQFSQQEFEDAVTELKITATNELRLEQGKDVNIELEHEQSSSIRNYLLVAIVLFVISIVVSYALYGERQKLVNWQETLERMPELSQQVLNNQAAAPSEEDLKDFALGLRSKLAKEPNAIGWMLLGRNLNMLRDLDGAIDAFDKSLRMDGSSASTMVSLAQALQERGEPGDYRRSIRVLKGALSLNPQNLTALILLAEGEMLDEQYESALQGFELVKKVISPNDPRKAAVDQRIVFISQKLGKEFNEEEAPGAFVNAFVNIVVELDESVELTKFSNLFVFAKSPSMPMPLAVKKLAVSPELFSNGRLSVTLTEQDVMMESLSLSSQQSVDIFARLSVYESAPYQPGDLQDTQANIAVQNSTNSSSDSSVTLRLTNTTQTEEEK